MLASQDRAAARRGALRRAAVLFARAYAEVPDKSLAHVLLECARLEEYAAPLDPEGARAILGRACAEVRGEWKVFLEAVLVEVRARHWAAAAACGRGLAAHSGTGRLWAALVQLRVRPAAWDGGRLADAWDAAARAAGGLPVAVLAPDARPPAWLEGAPTSFGAVPPIDDDSDGAARGQGGGRAGGGEEKEEEEEEEADARFGGDAWDFSWAQHATLAAALEEVPKSGEVWCEAARVALNPLARSFDLEGAARALAFAAAFTPQFGDSFLESTRQAILAVHLKPRALALAAALGPAVDARAEASLAAAIASLSDVGGGGGGKRADDVADEGASPPPPPPLPPPPSQSPWPLSPTCASVEQLLLWCTEAGLFAGAVLLAPRDRLAAALAAPLPGPPPESPRSPLQREKEEEEEDEDQPPPRGLTAEDLAATPTGALELRCTNADPNYGHMWFQCRGRPTDTPRAVLNVAQRAMAAELLPRAPLYLQAMVRRLLAERALRAGLSACRAFQHHRAQQQQQQQQQQQRVAPPPLSAPLSPSAASPSPSALSAHRLGAVDVGRVTAGKGWDALVGAALRRACPINPVRCLGLADLGGGGGGGPRPEGAPRDAATEVGKAAEVDADLLPRAEDFVTGLVGMNRSGAVMEGLSDEQRRKILFGCDQIIP